MILGLLYELAQREGLVEDPDYEQANVDFLVRIDDEGGLVTLVPLQDERGKGKRMSVPKRAKRAGTATKPFFLADNAKYVLGLSMQASERDALCNMAFRTAITEAAGGVEDEGLLALLRFYERFEENLAALQQHRPRSEWTGLEQLAFVRDRDGAQCIHERSAVRTYWRSRRGDAQEKVERAMCLVTGQVAPVATLHGNIKGVPNISSMGAALVSFNLSAFTSHGLSQGGNAPVSTAVAEGYVTALNWLLERQGDRRHRYGISLGDGVLVMWTKQKAPELDFLASLLDGSESVTATEGVRKAIESPWRGLEPSEYDQTAFYGLILGGNVARIVVQDWFTSPLGIIKANLRRYFEDLAIGEGEARPMPIRRLLDALKSPGRDGGIAPGLAARLMACALRGRPFPRQILVTALQRLRMPTDKFDPTRERCALIKAALLRLSPERRISVTLDESITHPPYLLGRLFAILERLQGVAQDNLNATIRDRYYGAASCTPAAVFPRLIKLSMHHASKADERGRWLEKLKGEVMAGLPAHGMPKILNLEEQGMFAIGYYHQRERFFVKKDA